MSIDSLQTEIQVKEIMNSPVVTLSRNEPAIEAAKLMRECQVGSVVITSSKDFPLGILTRTDMVNKLLADGKDPSKVKVEEIMSFPITTIDAARNVQDAAKLMSNKGITRLAVMHRGKLVGVLSNRDLVRVTPDILDILSEKSMIKKGEVVKSKRAPIIGYCDGCGQWSDGLLEVDGKFLCKDCLADKYGTA